MCVFDSGILLCTKVNEGLNLNSKHLWDWSSSRGASPLWNTRIVGVLLFVLPGHWFDYICERLKIQMGQWKTTEYKLRPYNALTEFYLHAFYVIISWFTATEEFWLVHFRITTCWYERYFEVKLKWAFIGVIVLILCSFLYALLFYIDHVNTNSILYSVMKDDFMSRYSKKSVPGSY